MVVLVLAHVLVLMPLAGYLYGRLRDTDAGHQRGACTVRHNKIYKS